MVGMGYAFLGDFFFLIFVTGGISIAVAEPPLGDIGVKGFVGFLPGFFMSLPHFL